MVIELDDFGCNRIITEQCQSHDCRDKLDELHIMNPEFKVTLFAIPFEMTLELLTWCKANEAWVALGVHGLRHNSNYETEKWTYEDMDYVANLSIVKEYFNKVFRSPGWQISDACYAWLYDNDWIVADQGYNDDRRPKDLKAYVNYDGQFRVNGVNVEAYHGHVWDVGWNGIYEDFDKVSGLVKDADNFQFIKELF